MKLFNYCILSTLLFWALCSPLQAQQLRWQWAVQANSTGDSRVSGTACDSAGNIYLTGSFYDTIRFGQQPPLTPVGDGDIYWAKFDTTGNVLWAKQASGTGRDTPTAMTVSEAGRIYTAGICGKETFPQQEEEVRKVNFFVSCHNPEGELQWAKTFGAKRSDHITSIAMDTTTGHIYFGGYFQQKLTIGEQEMTSAGSSDAFVACVDTLGEVVWAKSWGGSGADRITALRHDATTTGVLLLGDCDAPLSLAQATITPAQTLRTAVFTALCRPNGTIATVHHLMSGNAVDACCVMETADSLLLVGGNFSDSLFIGSGALYPYGNSDMFVTAIDSTGAPAWYKQLGSTAYDRLFDLLHHPRGHIIITGLYSGTLLCEGDTVSPGNAFCDVFTASFNHAGRLQEVNPMGGNAEEFPQVMTHDHEGHIFVAGLFRDTTQLRQNTLFTPDGSDELFLAKLYHCNKNRITFACDTVFAEGSLLSLKVQGAYEGYDWDHGAATSADYTVSCSKTYQVLVSDSLQCVYRDSITIRQTPAPPKVQIRAEVNYNAGVGCFRFSKAYISSRQQAAVTKSRSRAACSIRLRA